MTFYTELQLLCKTSKRKDSNNWKGRHARQDRPSGEGHAFPASAGLEMVLKLFETIKFTGCGQHVKVGAVF